MSLEEKSVAQVVSGAVPALDETQAPKALGDDAVPLRDLADGELLREREERVQVVARRRRVRRVARPQNRRAMMLGAVGLVVLATAVGALAAARHSAPEAPRPSPASTVGPPPALAQGSSGKRISAKRKSTGGVAQARRRAALRARAEAARRRARQRRRARELRLQGIHGSARDGRHVREVPAPPPTTGSPVVKEAASVPPSISVPPPAEAPPTEPSSPPHDSAPPTASGGAAAPAPSASANEGAAESEFGFER